MKRIIGIGLFIFLGTAAFAQTTTVSGTVADDQGKAVPFAFIKDSQHNYATFSNADGEFTLKADPASRLIATCSNYQESIVGIDNQPNVKIVLKQGAGADKKAKSSDAFQIKEENTVEKWARPLARFGTSKEDLHGSPYFFSDWVHGYTLTDKDSLRENDSYLFNYQKIDGVLLYTSDGKTMNMLDKSQAKKFVLFDGSGQQATFEAVPEIDNKHYFQVLASGSKYAIYKDLNTKFLKADFQTNGITTSGNNYDSYVDEAIYYVVKFPGGKPQKISLKRKAIKAAFAADADKINKYLTDHDSDEVDDNFLKGAGEYMNN